MQKDRIIEKWARIIRTDLKDVFLAGGCATAEGGQRALDRYGEVCLSLAEKLWEEARRVKEAEIGCPY